MTFGEQIKKREVHMSYVAWKEEYSVGVEMFDNQHKKLFACLNDLGEAINEVQEHAVLTQIIRDLIDYTRVHFRDEEANLQLYNVPGYKKHKNEHEILSKQVVDYALEFAVNKELAIQVMSFLKDWIIDHILGTDKEYSNSLRGKEMMEWDDIPDIN